MLEKLEHAQLETITVHYTAVHWYEREKEITVNATLFDVHSYFTNGDSVIFKGMFDTKETELKSQVTKLLKGSQDEKARRELVIAKMITQLWIAVRTHLAMQSLGFFTAPVYYFASTMLISTDISTFTPPPEV